VTSDAELERYYRQRAGEYEQIYYRDNPQRRREIDDEAVFLRELAAGRDVLEPACGTGYWTQFLAETAASVVCFDVSREMIEQARAKEYARPPLFCRASLHQVPFAPASFDLLVLGFWFSHHPRQDYDALFETISAPVRPGGLIWMIDNNPPAEGPHRRVVRVDRHGNTFKSRCLDNGREFVILKNYFSRDELVDLLARRFVIERLVYRTYYWSVVLRPLTT
jgi:demethylmenaquinone methyltransferase/2-methoxy-6-polyprenyl-1,4-benzoquinol methylase